MESLREGKDKCDRRKKNTKLSDKGWKMLK